MAREKAASTTANNGKAKATKAKGAADLLAQAGDAPSPVDAETRRTRLKNLIKLGKRTKEIAQILRLSPGTISIHRKNIRKKLELTHRKVNLQTVLSRE